jgi:hypothetical protein
MTEETIHFQDSSKTIYSLKNKKNYKFEKEYKLEIMEVSWNSTGLMIACCLGKITHDSSC